MVPAACRDKTLGSLLFFYITFFITFFLLLFKVDRYHILSHPDLPAGRLWRLQPAGQPSMSLVSNLSSSSSSPTLMHRVLWYLSSPLLCMP
ncbi:hypothetical protein LX36DRAFT_438912 [Colletotrichum falcatum]|nr:hypothetical protein LX36DRAFT_438912 [Colletotrichum falcatum]